MKNSKINVYYNSACPICSAGIQYQRKQISNKTVNWHDIHCDPTQCNDINVNIDTVRRYLHVRDNQGTLKIGVNAFIVLWQATPSHQWLASIISLPIVKQSAQLIYFLFANVLYAWNRTSKTW